MGSTSNDAQRALRAGASPPSQILDVVVLSTDGGLFAALQAASGAEHSLWPAPSADAAVELLVSGRCGVLIVDLGTLRGGVVALLERLHTQFPELVLLAAGRRSEESIVASLISTGPIYRFLHKPVSPARASAFMTAATRRYHELRHSESVALTTIKTLAAPRRLRTIILGVAVVAVVIGALAAWRATLRETLTPLAPLESLETDQQIADHLARAQIALASEHRLVSPPRDNALEHYRAVLALQPANQQALLGEQRVIALLEKRVEVALAEQNAASGATALAALQKAQPEHPHIEALRARLLTLSRSLANSAHPAPRESITGTSKASATSRRLDDAVNRPTPADTDASVAAADDAGNPQAADKAQ